MLDRTTGKYRFESDSKPAAAPKVYTLADVQERLTRVRTASGHGQIVVVVVNGQIVEIDTTTKERP